MPNIKNFSDPEKRQAMDRLHITTTSTPPARLQACPPPPQNLPGPQITTLSENSDFVRK